MAPKLNQSHSVSVRTILTTCHRTLRWIRTSSLQPLKNMAQAMNRLPLFWKTPAGQKPRSGERSAKRYQSLSGVPIPTGKKTSTPAKDAFLYLLAFSTLAIWTISLGSICYSLIDDWIRDPLTRDNYGVSLSYQISTELACLLVTFPLYLLEPSDRAQMFRIPCHRAGPSGALFLSLIDS